MKYFIDTEFIEGFHKPLFGKRRHFIDLISIGIVSEDGREYYAISNEYRYKDADKWVQDNVILPMYIDRVHGDARNRWDVHNFHHAFGKSNEQIANDIQSFCLDYQSKDNGDGSITITIPGSPEFYAYYADYDWVVFCSLFGRMIDLPKEFPMYCKDLKQIQDEKALSYRYTEDMYNDEKLKAIKKFKNYPPQENEHSAIDDARWNKKLYYFLQTI